MPSTASYVRKRVLTDLNNSLTLADGTGATEIHGLGGNDYLVGASGNDLIDGGTGNDVLYGRGGDDIITGGNGGDVLDGGIGIDTLSYADDTQGVNINLRLGKASGGQANQDRIRNFENVEGGTGNDSLTGNTGDNHLIGGEGDDTLEGGAGADWLEGGAGANTLSYATANTAVAVDLMNQTASGGDAAGDSISGFVHAIGSAGDDNLSGTAAANRLEGRAGNDSISGAGGDDVISGGGGNDTLAGGGGADVLLGGDGVDRLDYSASEAPVSINLADATASGGDAEGDSFSSIENVTGSTHNDTLIGNGNGNWLDGGAGDDVLDGGQSLLLVHDERGKVPQGWLGGSLAHGRDGSSYISAMGGKSGAPSLTRMVDSEGKDSDASALRYAIIEFDLLRVDSWGTEDRILIHLNGVPITDFAPARALGPGGFGNVAWSIHERSRADVAGGTAADRLIHVRLLIDNPATSLTLGLSGYCPGKSQPKAFGVENLLILRSSASDSQPGSAITHLDGGAGDDFINGTPCNDLISGGIGNDVIHSRGGTDNIDAGDGDDIVYLESPNHGLLVGGPGNDTLYIVGDAIGTSLDMARVTGFETIITVHGNIPKTGNAGPDTITGNGNDDMLVGYGGDDRLNGMDGDDVLWGGEGDDELSGGRGNDELHGEAGDDVLLGGDDNDTLYTGDGIDTVDGGDGNDILHVESTSGGNYAGGNGEDIISYAKLEQAVTVAFDNGSGPSGFESAFGGKGNDTFSTGTFLFNLDAGDGDDFVLVQSSEEGTWNGGQGFDTISFAGYGTALAIDLSGSTHIRNFEVVIGTNLADSITGGPGAHMLQGGAGNDTLAGGTGNDTLSGGADNDQLFSGGGVDVLDGGAGDDVIWAESFAGSSFIGGGGNDMVTWAMTGDVTADFSAATLSGIELIQGGAGNDFITGTTGDDVIAGAAGDDRLVGGGGNDVLYTGSGNDSADGGNGDDVVVVQTASFSTLAGGSGSDMLDASGLAAATLDFSAGNLNGFESVRGGTGADVFTLTAAITALTAGAGDDTVNFVSLSSGSYDGGAGNDTISYAGMAGGVTVAFDTGGGPSNFENVTGSAGNDSFTSGRVLSSLDGGDGDDFLLVQSTADGNWNGGRGNDTISFAGFTSGISLDLATATHVRNFEKVIGTSLADVFIGGAADETFQGGGGVDSFNGGAGNDTFWTTAFAGASFVGGSGNDTVTWAMTGNVTADFSAATVSGMELIQGGAGNDTITGTVGDDVISGGAGNDSLYGGTGNDTLSSGSGTDNLDGGAGDDVLVLESASYGTISGGAGNDLLDASAPTAVTINAAVFSGIERIKTGSGADVITATLLTTTIDSGAGDDTVNLIGVPSRTYDGGAGNDTLSFSAFNNDLQINLSTESHLRNFEILIGGSGRNTLTGQAGRDTLTGGDSNDVLDGYNLVQNGSFETATVSAANAWGNTVSLIQDWSFSYTPAGQTLIDQVGLTSSSGRYMVDTQAGPGQFLTLSQTIATTAGQVMTISFDTQSPTAGTALDVYYNNVKLATLTTTTVNQLQSWSFDVTTVASGVLKFVGGGAASFDGVWLDNVAAIIKGAAIFGDVMNGGLGDDILRGTAGADQLSGGLGNDRLEGWGNDDAIDGGSGDDIIHGGSGNDTATAGDGNDLLFGEDGNDRLYGGLGDDTIYGQNGDDMIYGNAGNDTMNGGAGSDVFVFAAGEGNDAIWYFDDGLDRLDVSAFTGAQDITAANFASKVLITGNGTNTVTASYNGMTTTIHAASNITIAADDFIL